MIDQIYNRQTEDWIAEQMRLNYKILIVSDGSYHPEYEIGTSSWVITAESDTSRRVYADNIVPGETYLQCPHRSELTGLIGAVKHILDISRRHNI